jgi:hypothetical protein
MRRSRPARLVNGAVLRVEDAAFRAKAFITQHGIGRLNVAGAARTSWS